ncbi:glycerol-3-phosphate 1-O-acyltransferase PlsY [bacterium]|nr:glycerol-3-phosphate 1-O-acyltransferase PlsY [bacterium]
MSIIVIMISYLIGAVPTAYVIGRVFRGIDLREHGSGNLGATNAFRVMGARLGAATLVVDIGKGVLAVGLGSWASGPAELPLVAGLAAIVGHNWPVYLRFRGGKGVATSAGVFLSLLPVSSLCALVAFGLVLWKWSYVSLASIVAAGILPLAAAAQLLTTAIDPLTPARLALAVLAGVLVILRHGANIGRLRRGQEKKIVFSQDKS